MKTTKETVLNQFISIILPTYNPNRERLRLTIESLKSQTLEMSDWEMIIVDNNSTNDFMQYQDLSWHQNSRVLREEQQGLTFARLKGFSVAKGNIIIMVDDDNILDRDYLRNCLNIFKENPSLGAIGGKSLPKFENTPPIWINEFHGSLALRDLGDSQIIEKWEQKYPLAAPIGAGMCLRFEALKSYLENLKSSKSIIKDRTGNSLHSGGDNEIIIEILKSGWHVGYHPQLKLEHIIPDGRTSVKYLAKLVNNTNQSWIELLNKHQINPWNRISTWTIPLRKIKSWFTFKAWQNDVNYIKWQGACGMFTALGSLPRKINGE